MKGLSTILAMSGAFLVVAGVAFGQGYYGYGNPGQYQSYGSYGDYLGAQAGNGQYTVPQGYGQQAPQSYRQQYGQQAPQSYGQQYGQSYGQPQASYGQQYSPQAYAAYQNYPGYSAYPNNQYGQYLRSGGRSAPARSARRRSTRHRSRAAASRTLQPQPSYTTPAVNRSRQRTASISGAVEQGTHSEVYWDGRESAAGQEPTAGVQRPTQPPAAHPVVRESRNSVNSPAVQAPRGTRRNIVRQAATRNSPPPANRSVKWGKEEKKISASKIKWGKEDKPTAVSAEPGSSQGPLLEAQSTSNPQAHTESKVTAKKFQWGKTN